MKGSDSPQATEQRIKEPKGYQLPSISLNHVNRYLQSIQVECRLILATTRACCLGYVRNKI
jgi:hypothetical protein